MKKIAIVLLGTLLSLPALAADIEAGKAKTAMCAACHGADGISIMPMYPNLKGQKAAYTEKQLKAFKDGSRQDPTMAPMAATLTDEDMANVAAYYESLK
jgi:cytochrome c553